MRPVKNDVQSIRIEETRIVKPPESLNFSSLAELYEIFSELLVGREFFCPRRQRIIVLPRHFFHLTKLSKGTQTNFKIEVEEPLIEATTEGFGEYAINEQRARTLSWMPEIMADPHEIWEYQMKKTADEVFIREYDKPGSPFRTVLMMREKGNLMPVTCMTVRRTGIKEHRKGKKLWPLERDSHSG